MSVPALRLKELVSNGSVLIALASYSYCLAASVFLGSFELPADDTGVEVGLLLLLAFIFGCWNPRRAWVAPLLGLSVPTSELLWGHAGVFCTGGLSLVAAVTAVVSLAGASAGVALRQLVGLGLSRS